ncbi:MAG: NAD(P)-dependent alcohol dehydrogenase [Myxococcota bacterium]
MQGAVFTRFGPPEVLRVQRLVRPQPRAGEVLIRGIATTVTAACTLMRRGDTLLSRLVLGLFRPRKRFQVAGIEFAGVIEAVGRGVSDWTPGQRVFGFAGIRSGPYAQYFCLPASASLAPMPQGVDYAEAATLVDGPTTAIHFLDKLANLRPRERLLVIGASGSVGGAAVQVGRSLGATVVGVCSTPNVELVRSLGAHAVIDYTKEDFTRGHQQYDVIFDAVTKSTFAACKRCLAPGGRYLPTGIRMWDYVLMAWTRLVGRRRVICGLSTEKRDALGEVEDLLARGELRPVIDRRYPLARISDAHRYVDTGRKRGNVVIEMEEPRT